MNLRLCKDWALLIIKLIPIWLQWWLSQLSVWSTKSKRRRMMMKKLMIINLNLQLLKFNNFFLLDCLVKGWEIFFLWLIRNIFFFFYNSFGNKNNLFVYLLKLIKSWRYSCFLKIYEDDLSWRKKLIIMRVKD